MFVDAILKYSSILEFEQTTILPPKLFFFCEVYIFIL